MGIGRKVEEVPSGKEYLPHAINSKLPGPVTIVQAQGVPFVSAALLVCMIKSKPTVLFLQEFYGSSPGRAGVAVPA